MTKILLALASLLAAADAPAAGIVAAERPVPGRYLVLLERAAAAGDPDGAARGLAARHGGAAERVYRHAVTGFSARLAAAAAAALSREPGVLLVEEDGEVSAASIQSPAPWALDRLDQRALPLDGAFSFDRTAGGVHAYVIDTGIRVTHAEFGGRAFEAFDAVGDGRGATDCNGHGTAVAALAGGATYGVAKGVALHAVRALGCDGTGTVSGVVAALDWVAGNAQRPAVAILSLTTGASPTLDAAVAGAIGAGLSAAVAAGNSGADACGYSPARVPAAITVGASTPEDRAAPFSNRGSCVDLFAPGQGVVSATSTSDSATQLWSGTSMAAPLAAGVAALLLDASPSATPAEIAGALASSATAGALAASPDLLLHATFAADPFPPTVRVGAPAAGAFVRGTVAASADALDASGVAGIELWADGVLLGAAAAPSLTVAWDTSAGADGPASLVARATDGAGNTGESAPVAVTVDNAPPACAITSPADGSSFRRSLTVRVAASDASGVSRVDLYASGRLVATDATAPFEPVWDARGFAKGTYSLVARAVDPAGNAGASAPVRVVLK